MSAVILHNQIENPMNVYARLSPLHYCQFLTKFSIDLCDHAIVPSICHRICELLVPRDKVHMICCNVDHASIGGVPYGWKVKVIGV